MLLRGALTALPVSPLMLRFWISGLPSLLARRQIRRVPLLICIIYVHMLIHLLMLMRRLHMYTHWRYILLLQTFTIPGLLYAQRGLRSYPLTETVQLYY